jgi:hypothetical protein
MSNLLSPGICNLFSIAYREVNDHFRANAFLAARFNSPAGSLYDHVTDRQSQAGSLPRCLGGVKWFENEIQLIRRDADAIIRERDLKPLMRFIRMITWEIKGFDDQRSCFSGLIYGIGGIDGKIDERLSKQGRIGPDTVFAGRQGELQFDMPHEGLILKNGADIR